MEVNGIKNSLVTNNLQNIFFYVPQKKESHTGLKWLDSEEIMTEFKFLGELSLYLFIFINMEIWNYF